MDTPKRYLSLFILIIFVTTYLSHAEERRVRIYNGLGSKVWFHCKSKDIDLGVQSFPPEGMWSFTFERSFFGISLFYCSFDLPNGRRWFDIYKEPRDYYSSLSWFKEYWVWIITPSGPCTYNASRKKICQCYSWTKN